MHTPTAVLAVLVLLAGSAGGSVVEARQNPPPFRTGVDLITIDVQITPSRSATIRDFVPSDFEITISGRKRPAVSATRLHDDTGTVAREPPRAHTAPECVFGFHRKTDRTTVHYLVGVEASEADRKEVKQVGTKMVDAAFAVQWIVWRSPIRRLASLWSAAGFDNVVALGADAHLLGIGPKPR